jgi:hypothetical protein
MDRVDLPADGDLAHLRGEAHREQRRDEQAEIAQAEGWRDGPPQHGIGSLVVPIPAAGSKDGGWRDFVEPSFKNQGDCVSYVATGGKNPPAGD